MTNTLAWDSVGLYGQNWYTYSTIRTLLNNPDTGNIYENCFALEEQNVIMNTYNGEISQCNVGTDSSNFRLNTTVPNDQLVWRTNIASDATEPVTYTDACQGGNAYFAYGRSLTGEKLFLLSSKEVINETYGFANNYTPIPSGTSVFRSISPGDVNRLAKSFATSGNNSRWWLRSAYSYGCTGIAIIDLDGKNGYATSGDIFWGGRNKFDELLFFAI